MNKKYVFGVGIIATIALAVLVYAWAFDSDGGFNPTVQGTYTDNFGNHTDYCLNVLTLVEYYPYTNTSNFTYCVPTR